MPTLETEIWKHETDFSYLVIKLNKKNGVRKLKLSPHLCPIFSAKYRTFPVTHDVLHTLQYLLYKKYLQC